MNQEYDEKELNMSKPETATPKTCFIVMPITVSENHIPIYRDKEEHFKHVLECLLIPAVEKAGFIATPPTAKGADLIHAGIINHLETSDIVLCDMSTLNPNVFFECGIRISLNKPVCLVKGNFTSKIPFDTAVVNYQEYKSTLEPWELPVEIETLSKHIKDSYDRSLGQNSLWKYFGFKSEAVPAKGDFSDADKFTYLSNKIDELSLKLDESSSLQYASTPNPQYISTSSPQYISTSGKVLSTPDNRVVYSEPDIKIIFGIAENYLRQRGIEFINMAYVDDVLSITFRKKISEKEITALHRLLDERFPNINKIHFKYIYT
jgi:hypothetical protein